MREKGDAGARVWWYGCARGGCRCVGLVAWVRESVGGGAQRRRRRCARAGAVQE